MNSIPTGTVTFLFTDIEDSTLLWERDPASMRINLARHEEILNRAIQTNGGTVFKTVGDEFCVAFRSAPEALRAAVEAQINLSREGWQGSDEIKVRMAMHSDVAEVRGGDYFGAALSRVARFRGLGFGGQILLSESTRNLVLDHLPDGASVTDLGLHRLKGFTRDERVYQVRHPDLEAVFPRLRSASARPNNLPQTLTSLIGREQDEREVTRLMSKGRLLTLTGAGGCGKTRLALEVAADLIGDFEDGVWLVDLTSVSEPAFIAQSIADVLSVLRGTERSGVEAAVSTPEQLLASELWGRSLLLVLDNCEHLVDACAQLSRLLLERCPGLRILATSREALGIQGELIWVVQPLAVPPSGPPPALSELAALDSVRLFLERGAAVRPGFDLTETNAADVAKVCLALDGIPLALELAAARLRAMTISSLAAAMEDRFSLLGGPRRETPSHHQTLTGAIDWSYDLLPEDEKRIFRRLSVFAGGWTADAARSVASAGGTRAAWEPLLKLVEKSLVVLPQNENEDRYRMMQTIQAYAAQKLEDAGELQEAREAHCQWFLQLAEAAEPHLRQQSQAEWLRRLDQDHDNLRAAMKFSELSDPVPGLRIATSLGRFWSLRGELKEGREWIEGLLVKVLDPPASLRARALYFDSLLAADQADFAAADRLARESQGLFREAGDELGAADAGVMLARATWSRGDLDGAADLLTQALADYRRLGDRQHLNAVLNNLGVVQLRRGRHDEARPLLEESLALKRELGDDLGVAGTLHNLGVLAAREGDAAKAAAFQNDSLALARRLGNKRMSALALFELGRIRIAEGDHDAARERLIEALQLVHDLGDRARLAECLEALARIAAARLRLTSSARLCGAAQALREATDVPVPSSQKDEYQRVIDELKQRLSRSAFEQAWAEGHTMSADEALAYALADAPEPEQAETPARTATTTVQGPYPDHLSEREVEVLRLIAAGRTNQQIADELVISLNTVLRHVSNIYAKIGAANRSDAVSYAHRNRLTT